MEESLELRKEQHELLLKTLYKEKYEQLEKDKNAEFTWDGPSNWEKYFSQPIRVLFLLKEARGEFHPNVPEQKLVNNTGRNIALWNKTIQNLFADIGKRVVITDMTLPTNNDDVALVEVKKLNEEKSASSLSEINQFARSDKELLASQIDLIDPHIVVCCGTISAYDIIHDETYEPYDELGRCGARRSWKLNNRLVIEFFHPATWHLSKSELVEYLADLLNDGEVFRSFDWYKKII